jgi:prepilin-type N-terminal cleavage/methylation domain-containing protein
MKKLRLRARKGPSTSLRTGFSLIEIMVAMTILAIVMSSLARLATIIAVRGRGNDFYAKRSLVLQREANKFGAAPLAVLAAWNTADATFTVGGFTYTRKLTITQTSSKQYSIKIVVIPSTATTSKDSVMFDRTNPPSTTALCTSC